MHLIKPLNKLKGLSIARRKLTAFNQTCIFSSSLMKESQLQIQEVPLFRLNIKPPPPSFTLNPFPPSSSSHTSSLCVEMKTNMTGSSVPSQSKVCPWAKTKLPKSPPPFQVLKLTRLWTALTTYLPFLSFYFKIPKLS